MHIELCRLAPAVFKGYLHTHDPQNADKGLLTVDGVHLSAQGHFLVAQEMMESLLAALKDAQRMPMLQGCEFVDTTDVAIGFRPG